MRRTLYLWLACLAALSCNGCRGEKAPAPLAGGPAPDGGVLLAQVGSQRLYDWQVEGLARAHRQLLEQLELPPLPADTPRQKLERAVELLALAQVARRDLPGNGWLEEAGKRLLARVYLRRLVEEIDRQPVDDKRLGARYRELRRQVLSGEESELYKPTRIDALAVVVAYLPDLSEPGGSLEPVVTAEQAWQLAQGFQPQLAAAASDSDEFLSVARHLQEGHPTVRILQFWKTLADPSLSVLDRQLHRQLLSLPEEGSVSQPFRTSRGVVILRRGATNPGRGETLEQLRGELTEMVKQERRAEAVASHLKALLRRLRVVENYRLLKTKGEGEQSR